MKCLHGILFSSSQARDFVPISSGHNLVWRPWGKVQVLPPWITRYSRVSACTLAKPWRRETFFSRSRDPSQFSRQHHRDDDQGDDRKRDDAPPHAPLIDPHAGARAFQSARPRSPARPIPEHRSAPLERRSPPIRPSKATQTPRQTGSGLVIPAGDLTTVPPAVGLTSGLPGRPATGRPPPVRNLGERRPEALLAASTKGVIPTASCRSYCRSRTD
jgi:hypothetical protein